MEKILLAVDALRLNTSTLEFACYLGRLTKSRVTGVFLENSTADEKPVLKQYFGTSYMGWEPDEESPERRTKDLLIEKNIFLFKEGCINREVSYKLHRDRGVPVDELIKESRFADLIVVDATISFANTIESAPSAFVKELLRKSECPVIIAPESFAGIEEVVFTYDGSAAAVFAIKQFAYLFPQLLQLTTTVVQVNETGTWTDPEKFKFTEWLKAHCSNLRFEVLKGAAGDRLFDFAYKRKNMLLVMGAYSRSALSQFFMRSHADLLIKTITQPIFIAHA